MWKRLSFETRGSNLKSRLSTYPLTIKNFKIFVGTVVRTLFKIFMIFTWVVDYVVVLKFPN